MISNQKGDTKTSSRVKIIGLISDTHVPTKARELRRRVFEIFKGVDFIIHAGDLVDFSVVEKLEGLAPVLAVYGNMDDPEVRGRLPKRNSVKVFGWRVGVMHDPGVLHGVRKMLEVAKENGFNVLVYGHTHHPSVRWEGRVLLINPGSPTAPVPPFITKPTVALLRVYEEKMLPEIVPI
ncbi:MAG: metallophosphoesterase [Candidatus Bathyarchaeia archaeon]